MLAFVALDTDGNRVLAKYYKPKHSPQQFADAKPLSTLKEQRAYEKSLWEKTEKLDKFVGKASEFDGLFVPGGHGRKYFSQITVFRS